ncbi:hypothetical protein BKA56DRAFT_616895 [Ilyonectria sp. MPI-CAGE-AT-0026]|nr:hypothetical protein BKA56DRAFT_616895 [Ilyonectria sp. MPI-CAGE-AT-0026]
MHKIKPPAVELMARKRRSGREAFKGGQTNVAQISRCEGGQGNILPRPGEIIASSALGQDEAEREDMGVGNPQFEGSNHGSSALADVPQYTAQGTPPAAGRVAPGEVESAESGSASGRTKTSKKGAVCKLARREANSIPCCASITDQSLRELDQCVEAETASSCGWRDSFMRWQAGEGHDDNDCLQLEWACLVTWA